VPTNLSPQAIKALAAPASGNRVEWDTQEQGLGIRITAAGARAFVLRYVAQGRERRMTLGDFPALTLTAARQIARERKREVARGADPLAAKAAARGALTLGKAAEAYLAAREAGDGRRAALKPRSLEEARRALERHWKPLHGLPLAAVGADRIAARLDGIAKASGPVAANRARANLSALFAWAVRKRYVVANPVAGTEPAVAESALRRGRWLSDDELRAVWQATEGSGDYSAIVRLLVLTGQRREEVGGMRWGELDLGAALWSLPGERTKNGLPHDVPLSAEVLAILRALPRMPGRELVFGSGRGPFSAWSSCKAALDGKIAKARAAARLGRPLARGERPDPTLDALPEWRLHDLRRTLVTGMNELEIAPHVVEAVVNHVSGEAKRGVAGTYNHAKYNPQKRRALNLWGAHVAALVAGEAPKVVPLRPAAAVA
jgi:integrase